MAKEKNPQYGEKVKTGECFASFPHLAEPDTGKQYSDNKYKLDAIFCDKESMKALVAECKKLAKTNFGTEDGIKFPWKNGNDGSVSNFQGYPDRYYITPKTNKQIPVVGPNPKIVFDPAKVYGGAVVRVNVTPKAYTMPEKVIEVQPDGARKEVTIEKKGITLYLNAVQFIRDSERFGGGDDPTGGFEDVSDGDTDDDVMADF